MKKISIALSLLAALLFFTCGSKKTPKPPVTDTISTGTTGIITNSTEPVDTANRLMTGYMDTSLVWTDTVLILPGYRLMVTKNKYDADHHLLTREDTWLDAITLYGLDLTTDSILYSRKTEHNQYVNTYSFNDSLHYIILSESGGGSGYTSGIYKIEPGPGMVFTQVFGYSELSFYTFSNDGSELVYLSGIWATEKGEAHFEDHRYYIGTVDLAHGNRETEIGTTKYKYPSDNDAMTTGQLLQKILKKEPALLKKLDLQKYSL